MASREVPCYAPQVVLYSAKVVPQGMLVFLPSYSLMDKLLERWKVRCLPEGSC